MTSPEARPRPNDRMTAREPSGLRLDIQGLRAIAVGLVVIYHLWPWHLTGGYIGVDVFFVISGFLITAHLVREVDLEGAVNLPRFWARRARRLLPASLLVLAVVLVATAILVPRALWSQFSREVVGSALYVENLLLAVDSVDYLAAENAASPVQHYWSLSAEEQFYVLWPLLIVAALWVARRSGLRRRAISIGLGLVTVASFITSLVWTASAPAQAYFVTPTRAWEFGVGGLLAMLPAVVGRHRVRALLAWVGIGLIGAAAVVLDGNSPFPGPWALLPVAGTALVLWSNADSVPGSPTTLLRWRPVQVAGELSYSIYLWHWAVIVIFPFAVGRDLFALDKLALVVGVWALSYATWRWVENPVRRSRALNSRKPRVTFALTLVAMAVIVVVSMWMSNSVDRQVNESLEESDRLSAQAKDSRDKNEASVVCLGAAAVDPEGSCTGTFPEGTVIPIPAAARLDSPTDCLAVKGTRGFEPCEFGVASGDAVSGVALIGDSHAYHWLPALEEITESYDWHGLVMARESCPFTTADRTLDSDIVETCGDFNESVLAELEERPDISVVFMGAYSDLYFDAPEGSDEREFARDKYQEAIESLPDHIEQIYVLRDAPKPRADNVECVEAQLDDGVSDPGAQCTVPREEGLVRDVLFEAAGEVERAHGIDLSGLYCDDDVCQPTVGNVMVYADQGHLTRTWVRSTVPIIERQIPAISDSL